MKESITAMYARKNFGRLLDKIALLNESYIIERAGRPMAALISVNRFDGLRDAGSEAEAALENLIKRIKGSKSKKLEKAILDAREAVSKLQL